MRGTQIDDLFVEWKRVYVESKSCELQIDLARSVVKEAYRQFGVDYFVTTVGTIPLQHRQDKVTIDWKAIAHAGIPRKKLKALIVAHTTSEEVAPVLQAPNGWTAEAGVAN